MVNYSWELLAQNANFLYTDIEAIDAMKSQIVKGSNLAPTTALPIEKSEGGFSFLVEQTALTIKDNFTPIHYSKE
jgi:hypothetical protein